MNLSEMFDLPPSRRRPTIKERNKCHSCARFDKEKDECRAFEVIPERCWAWTKEENWEPDTRAYEARKKGRQYLETMRTKLQQRREEYEQRKKQDHSGSEQPII